MFKLKVKEEDIVIEEETEEGKETTIISVRQSDEYTIEIDTNKEIEIDTILAYIYDVI